MRTVTLLLGLLALGPAIAPADDLRPVPLKAKVDEVQPMTGIVLWTTNDRTKNTPIQLEFSYLGYDQVVDAQGKYDWSAIDKLLDQVAARKHQAVIRWHDTYVGKPTRIPASIKALPDYRETTALSEKKRTGFPDWSHPELRRFLLEFVERFAERYDRDPRIAFVEVGFGLWAEYHIYDGPMILGKTFPSVEFQAEFAAKLDQCLKQTPWMVSVDAALDFSPFASAPATRALRFGLFDDSFNHANHAKVNEPNWDKIGRERWKASPIGGEFSFYVPKDQRDALAPAGPHGIPFAKHAATFHVSFMIGDGQPRYQKPEVIRDAGLACGYRFRVTRFESSAARAVVEIENIGIAPIYHDAFPAVAGVRSPASLKGLLPGERRTFEVAAGGTALSIECDRLVPGQRISFDADLP